MKFLLLFILFSFQILHADDNITDAVNSALKEMLSTENTSFDKNIPVLAALISIWYKIWWPFTKSARGYARLQIKTPRLPFPAFYPQASDNQ